MLSQTTSKNLGSTQVMSSKAESGLGLVCKTPVAAFVGGKRVSLNIASRHGSVEITCETADNGKQRLAKNE